MIRIDLLKHAYQEILHNSSRFKTQNGRFFLPIFWALAGWLVVSSYAKLDFHFLLFPPSSTFYYQLVLLTCWQGTTQEHRFLQDKNQRYIFIVFLWLLPCFNFFKLYTRWRFIFFRAMKLWGLPTTKQVLVLL